MRCSRENDQCGRDPQLQEEGRGGLLWHSGVRRDLHGESGAAGGGTHSRPVFQVEQITTEYKVRALQYHPDKNEGDKEAEQKFQLLKVNFPKTLPN